MKIIKLHILVILTLNLVLLAGQLAITSYRATEGIELTKIQNQLQQIILANGSLRKDIYDLSSTPALLSRSMAADLVPSQVSLVSPAPLAAAMAHEWED